MLPAGKRLNRHQFSLLSSDPALKTVYNRLGTIKYKYSPTTQCSVVTSSKQEKKAVVRNKVRRRIYTLLAPNFSCIIYVSKHAYTMSYDDIKTLLYELVRKMEKNPQ